MPEILFPRAIGNFISLLLNLSSEIISLKNTSSLFEFGISIPIVFSPGIVATLVEIELVFLAMSSAKLIIFETLIPDAGSNSFNVTTGPQLILLILPSTPKSSNIFSKNSEFLEKILLDFGVEGKIKGISYGPVVTLNEFEPASGIKVSKIVNLADDIARNTSSISTRVATIPGKSTIGIEIPNSKRENVFLSEIISDEKFNKRETKLPIALGKSISGVPVVGDLSAMPHLLIAGTTGSGKSVCINTIILSLLYKYTPEKCNLI